MNELIPLYRAMAADGSNFRGLSVLQHTKQIGQLVKLHRAKTLLDFGCGAGDAYKSPFRVHREWGLQWFDVQLHDPAFPEHADKPFGLRDGVLCSDVLEHIPEADVDATIATLFKHAKHFVWASVCCREAKKCFPDGTNLHVTLQPLSWWSERFTAAQLADGRNVHFTLVETP